MKTSVKTMNRPETKVQFSNISLDIKAHTFEVTVGTKDKGKRKFTEQIVKGKISIDLYKWLTEMHNDKIQVAADNEAGFQWINSGTKSTGFQRFLAKKQIEFKSGILKELVFESQNNSPEYSENPFKILMYANGNASLTLVNVAPIKKVETHNPVTGEVTESWKKRFVKLGDTYKTAFYSKKNFTRLAIQSVQEFENFVAPKPQPSIAQ